MSFTASLPVCSGGVGIRKNAPGPGSLRCRPPRGGGAACVGLGQAESGQIRRPSALALLPCALAAAERAPWTVTAHSVAVSPSALGPTARALWALPSLSVSCAQMSTSVASRTGAATTYAPTSLAAFTAPATAATRSPPTAGPAKVTPGREPLPCLPAPPHSAPVLFVQLPNCQSQPDGQIAEFGSHIHASARGRGRWRGGKRVEGRPAEHMSGHVSGPGSCPSAQHRMIHWICGPASPADETSPVPQEGEAAAHVCVIRAQDGASDGAPHRGAEAAVQGLPLTQRWLPGRLSTLTQLASPGPRRPLPSGRWPLN